MVTKLLTALLATLPINLVYSTCVRMNKKKEMPNGVLYIAAFIAILGNILTTLKVVGRL